MDPLRSWGLKKSDGRRSGLTGRCLWSCHPRPGDTQVLRATTEAMERRRRDYRVERQLLDQEQLEELGRWGPAPRTRWWRTSLQ